MINYAPSRTIDVVFAFVVGVANLTVFLVDVDFGTRVVVLKVVVAHSSEALQTSSTTSFTRLTISTGSTLGFGAGTTGLGAGTTGFGAGGGTTGFGATGTTARAPSRTIGVVVGVAVAFMVDFEVVVMQPSALQTTSTTSLTP